MKFFDKIKKYILPSLVLFLLAFIPLYPKLPLVDIQNTWVYIRVEDFLVFLVLGIWFYLLLKKEVTLKTPLTIPILAFWTIGAVATIHGVVVIFPTISNVFPNVALLAYLRHIEYLSLFFVAYSAVKSKKFALAAVWTVVATLLGVVAYGFGQKYLSLPAYLTMNEEYAKGIPIIISPLNRISSTFAGHYDLAAYLVLVIPILVSLFFGFKNIFLRLIVLISSLLGFALLFMTVSRVSFFVLFIALFFVFLFHKRKTFLMLAPIICIGGALFLLSQQSLLARFGNTVKEVDVLVEANSGVAIGHVTFFPRDYLYDKIIVKDEIAVGKEIVISNLERERAIKEGVPIHLIPLRLPREAAIVPAEITSTGETLPQGSGYINLSLSPVTKRLTNFFYEYPPKGSTTAATVKRIPGDYLVKRASAYDLSFTTRFQGEWPNALLAFGRNLFLGSGYGSVSLAVDNNYYRMLGETGLFGTLSFVLIFLILGIYIKKTLPNVESRVLRSFVLGFTAGVIGLSLNAILIDVFEASKVAFQLWLLVGIVIGILSLYQTKHFNLYREIFSALTSSYAVIVYLLLLTVTVFSTSLSAYFIGDDFTWFRWAADCKLPGNSCSSVPSIISQYFFNSEGFFYRPGTKTYFLLMYPLFWLNQIVYHFVSVALHFIVAVLLYLIARKILKKNLLASASSFIFLIASGYLEIVLWISSTGHLFSAVFILSSLLLFIQWYEKRKIYYLVFSLLSSLFSLAFYEQGIISPFLMIAYALFAQENLGYRKVLNVLKQKVNLLLFAPNIFYLGIRYFAQTHWFGGDYSYNLLKLPLNIAGNIFGYLLISIFGPLSYPLYEKIRLITKTNIPMAVIIGIIFTFVLFFVIKTFVKSLDRQEKRIALFSALFFIICLIPFLGLGNITFRYSYLASFGIIMLVVMLGSKIFRYITYYGKDVAIASVVTLFSVFSLFHIIQAQQAMIEWNGSGEKVKNFLTSIDSHYADPWSKKDTKSDIYFSNVPVKNGDAWVFPVGLNDAVWFAFKNENIQIHQVNNIEEVSQDTYKSTAAWVYKFQPDGSLRRIVWGKKGPIEDDK
ncbi:MAG: O-antigen ligase family protein [Candidatus Levybacteria bacterium]|nr:O-antigen ligase family protein [Candidatus Levybacteria bacterium]